MPTKRCCCGYVSPCLPGCIAAGGANCGIESARTYTWGSAGSTTFHGTGESCCQGVLNGPISGSLTDCLAVVKNKFDSGDCVWESEDCEDCDVSSTLTISAGPSAVLTITIGAYTIVYKSMSGYDPLCTSGFRYSEADSTPPDECSWSDTICVTPKENCCPDYAFPDTLEVATHVVGFGDCSCGDDTPARNTLTRVSESTPPPAPYRYTDSAFTDVFARYIGIIDIGSCGHFLYVTMECIEESGDNRMYLRYEDDDTNGNCWPSDEFASEEPSSCDPFVFNFIGSSDDAFFCCPGSFRLDMTVFDPA